MSKLHHILRIGAKALAGVAVLAALGFVEKRGDSLPVRDIAVQLDNPGGMHFIDAEALRQEVVKGTGPVIGTAVGQVDEAALERRLREIPCVADADVYHTMDGVLHVRARQREPIVRVINADGSGFYIDKDGWTMPLSPGFTARVLVVTGQLNEPFAATAPVNVADAADSLALHSRSHAIHALALTLAADPLWKSLFSQAVVDAEGNFTLVPIVGLMNVRVGDGGRLAARLEKLRTFFAEGIPQADWRRYSSIDLRFNDQVVCTKRTNY